MSNDNNRNVFMLNKGTPSDQVRDLIDQLGRPMSSDDYIVFLGDVEDLARDRREIAQIERAGMRHPEDPNE